MEQYRFRNIDTVAWTGDNTQEIAEFIDDLPYRVEDIEGGVQLISDDDMMYPTMMLTEGFVLYRTSGVTATSVNVMSQSELDRLYEKV